MRAAMPRTAKSSRHPWNPLASSGCHAASVIHEEQIGVNLRRQCNCRLFRQHRAPPVKDHWMEPC